MRPPLAPGDCSPSRFRRFLRALACPACGGELMEAVALAGLSCQRCGASYPVERGVPILLTEESRRTLAAGDEPVPPSAAPPWFSGRWAEGLRAWCRTGFGADRHQPARLAAFVGGASEDELVVDLGSGSRRLADRVVSVDIGPFPGVDVVGDGHRLPFRDDSIARIVCTGVLEHVTIPERVVREMVRVLRPGGLAYVSVPFIQGFHPGSGTQQDFQRYTHIGLAQLLASFRILESGTSGGPSTALGWILREYLALPFAWSRLAYAIAYRVAGLLTCWLRWLDVPLERSPQAHRIACGFYAIGERPQAGASGAERA